MKAKGPLPPPLPQRLSLVAQTVQSLRESIRTGYWQSHLPPERELCSLLQVSRATLRAALAEMQRKGWLDVSPRQGRRIKPKRSTPGGSAQKRVIAVLAASPLRAMAPPVGFLMDTLREMLAKADCSVEFHVNRACFAEKPARALEKLVRQNPTAVWLIFGSKEPMQHWFISQKLPCLLIGSCSSSVALPSIDTDHRAVCRHAGGVLLRKGHRRIALLLPQDPQGGDLDSEQGLRELLEATPDTRLRVMGHDGTASHICSLMDDAMNSPHPPTAYIVARAKHVLTVMMHLMRRGKRIPQDVAVISRDDDPFLQSTTPAVTHYAADSGQFARRISLAARQLAETGTLGPKAIRIIPKFTIGETV